MGTSDPTASVTFVGNATTLLRLGGFTLLTDPNFLHAGQRAYLGYGMWTRRLKDPALGIPDLPSLDAVLLSHLHGDHFDRVARRGLPRHLPVVTTPAAQRRLRRWGFRAASGLATWESHEFVRGDQLLRVTAVPAHHGPRGLARLLPPTMGEIIELERDGQPLLRVYVSGDTLYRADLAEIPRRYPRIDAMLVHLGGTRILGVLLTLDGRQGNRLTRLIRPRVTVPIHYDDYTVMRSPLRDYVSELDREAPVTRLLTVRRGETVELPVSRVPNA